MTDFDPNRPNPCPAGGSCPVMGKCPACWVPGAVRTAAEIASGSPAHLPDEPMKEERDTAWLSIESAPRDGTVVSLLYRDGNEGAARWQEERYCILGAPAGTFGPGWQDVEENLPVSNETHWRPAASSAERQT